MPNDDRRLVYSSESGFLAEPEAGPAKARGPATKPLPPQDGVIRIARERRRASTVSLVHGLNEREIADVAKALKRHCGTGGTTKNGTIEIQGDHREKIAAWFAAQGRKAKLAGG
ncbi:MAG: stress response translation initiation inhibitor YciH [Vulcanimicrobiaceae bacterium]